MVSRVILEPKAPSETKIYYFDFTSQLAASETISTKSTAATVYSGTDASPSSIVNGAAGSSGQVVSQSITAGTEGVIYLLTVTITTSASQTLQMTGLLGVVKGLL